MPPLKILTAPHATLRQKASPVEAIDSSLIRLAQAMSATLNLARVQGLGLSAPQVGKSLQLFVMLKNNASVQVFLNPKILYQSRELNTQVVARERLALEGCLSIPRIFALIERPWEIKISYQTFTPNQSRSEVKKIEKATVSFIGLESTLVQHEIDHLNGILFTDHALAQGATLYEWDKKEDRLREVIVG